MWLSKRNTQEPHQGNESEKMADSMRTMRGTNGNNEWHRTHEENHHFFIKKAEFYQSRENVKKKWKIDRKNINLWHHSTFSLMQTVFHLDIFPLSIEWDQLFIFLTDVFLPISFHTHFVLGPYKFTAKSLPYHSYIMEWWTNDSLSRNFITYAEKKPK